jgi:Fe-S-cluster-containing dehydrogenase component/CRP-like cAMP-binding protein
MSSAVQAAAQGWPKSVWSAAIFRGLDARAMREFEAAGRLLEFAPGSVVFEQGAVADSFFVVASGSLELRATRARSNEPPMRVRSPREGELFGEEAMAGVPRQVEARAVTRAQVVEIPVHLFRRAIVRLGRAELLEKTERTLKRAAARDVIAATPLGQSIGESELDALLDAVSYHSFERGQTLYRAGDASTSLFIVGDGLIQLQVESEGRARVHAYFGRGDFFGDQELETATVRTSSAVANGPSTVLAIPARVVRGLAKLDERLFAGLRKVGSDTLERQRELVGGAAKHATEHVFRDLYRMQVAGSLLLIDLDTCVRCGHCAWACASLYGESRLLREGDKLLRPRSEPEPAQSEQPNIFASAHYLLPNSCQHCDNPACMVGCPTGAIAKDARGEVFIRKELCTGCGACAKACPWDNIQMKPRAPEDPRPQGTVSSDVADKCDLCREQEGGPMCVRVCPVSAIVRVHPKDDWSEIAGALGKPLSTAPAAASAAVPNGPSRWLASGLIRNLALGVATLTVSCVGALLHSRGLLSAGAGRGYAAGWIAGGLVLALLGYSVPKRGLVWLARARRRKAAVSEPNRVVSVTAAHYRAHALLGLALLAAVPWHAPKFVFLPGSLGGLLTLTLSGAALSGAGLAALYWLVPRRLARLERKPLLPENLQQEKEELGTRLYKGLSGKDALLKKVAEKVLLPYARSHTAGLALLFSGRDLRAEASRLEAQIQAQLSAPAPDRLEGLHELVRISVELAAWPLVRGLNASLRVLLPIHIVLSCMTLLLLILHIVQAIAP